MCSFVNNMLQKSQKNMMSAVSIVQCPLEETKPVEKDDNFLLHSVCISAVFPDDLRLIFTVSVSWNFDIIFPKSHFYHLFRVAVSVVFRHTFAFFDVRSLFSWPSFFSSSASITVCSTSMNSSFMPFISSFPCLKSCLIGSAVFFFNGLCNKYSVSLCEYCVEPVV